MDSIVAGKPDEAAAGGWSLTCRAMTRFEAYNSRPARLALAARHSDSTEKQGAWLGHVLWQWQSCGLGFSPTVVLLQIVGSAELRRPEWSVIDCGETGIGPKPGPRA